MGLHGLATEEPALEGGGLCPCCTGLMSGKGGRGEEGNVTVGEGGNTGARGFSGRGGGSPLPGI